MNASKWHNINSNLEMTERVLTSDGLLAKQRTTRFEKRMVTAELSGKR